MITIYCFTREDLEIVAYIFEVLTPIVLFCWFIFSRRAKFQSEYFRKIPGKYGAFIAEPHTIHSNEANKRYEGGIRMQIFDIDENGYFRGQFEYYENEITLGAFNDQGILIRAAETAFKSKSTNFFAGRVSYKWNYLIFKNRNPLRIETNRKYLGKMNRVERLDSTSLGIKGLIHEEYEVIHFRESRVLQITRARKTPGERELPDYFRLIKSYPHSLDPYRNVKIIFENTPTR